MTQAEEGGAAWSMTDFFGPRPIWTPEIGRKAALVAQWLACDVPGALIWGLQHGGKTEFTKYLVEVLPTMVGGNLAGYIWDFSGFRTKKAEDILKRCLICSGNNTIASNSRVVLQQRLVDTLVRRCRSAGISRILIVLDEVQNIAQGQFEIFMSVLGDLMRDGLRPHFLSVGQPEMQQTVDLLHQEDRLQLIGRFFVQSEPYYALTVEEVGELLDNMDGPERTFTAQHFPPRHALGFAIAQLAVPLTQAVDAIATAQSLSRRPRIPMRYLRPVLNMVFRFLQQNPEDIVDAGIVMRCFDAVGLTRVISRYVAVSP